MPRQERASGEVPDIARGGTHVPGKEFRKPPWDLPALFPRIEQRDFIRVIDGISGDEDQVVGERGGRDEAVENRQAAALALVSGTEFSPFAHDLAGRRKQAVFGPAVQALKPCGDLFFSFARRKKFDALDDFAEGDGGEVRFVIAGIQPVHDRFIRLGIRGFAQNIGIEQETHVI